jgi:hypothetical protein
LVRRCVVRAHPDRIIDAEALTLELEALGEELARLRSPIDEETPPALRVAREMIRHEAPWSLEDTVGGGQPWAPSDGALAGADSGNLGSSTAPAVFTPVGGYPAPRRAPSGGPRIAPRLSLPSRPLSAVPRDGAQYPDQSTTDAASPSDGGPTLMVALLLGTGLFAVCFLIGFFILH